MTQSNLKQAYNDLPYPSKVFAHCQPTRLHALAKIKGLNPPPLEKARVLEIGCSFGGNLIPFAMKYPNSKLTGVDLSNTQIEIGNKMLQEIGIKNIDLIANDITNVKLSSKFDYIICHGVFSWVPESVQEGILATIRETLSDNGIAFISYNTYPGWHLKDMAKELMLFGSDEKLDPISRVEQSLEMLKYTDNIINRQNSAISHEVSRVFEGIVDKSTSYLAHEFFEHYNQPFYFREFNKKLGQHNLAYVSDSTAPNIKSKMIFTDEEYQQVCQYFNNDIVSVEQYTDIILNRGFRTSIITKQENLPNYDISVYELCHSFFDIYVKTYFEYINDGEKNYWKVGNDGVRFLSTKLSDKLVEFFKHETPICVKDIISKVEKEPYYDADSVKDMLLHIIYAQGTYLCFSPEKLNKYGKKPKLSEKIRNFIKYVNNNPNVTTLSNYLNQVLILPFLAEYISPYLDGSNTIEDLVAIIRADIEKDIIEWKQNDKILKNADLPDEEIIDRINEVLEYLYLNGLFNKF